jgi:nucleoside-diphosphate-sugar epimerase
MRILITGRAGFIGSHLSELLISEGNHIIALDNQSTGSGKNLNLSSSLRAACIVKGYKCEIALNNL